MLKQAYYAAMSGLARVEQRRQVGTSIFDSDEWDVCIVLDSCRLDMLREHLPHHTVDGVWSVGSVTTEWLANTFHEERCDVSNVGFVSATPHSETVFERNQYLTDESASPVTYPEPRVVSKEAFAGFHELWRTSTGKHGVVWPETMFNATMEAAERYERVVAHWMQPHEPFVGDHTEYVGGEATEKNVWRDLENGLVDKDTVWAAYRDTLRYAMIQVSKFVRAFDGTVLITSDHGNAFGRFGVCGHPFGWVEPCVRRVPWLMVDGRGVSGYEYESVLDGEVRGGGIGEQLEALGYR